MNHQEYEDPVEQVMFILGLKHDPRFATVLHAVAAGASPGIINALDALSVYGAISANFHAWAKTMKKIQDEIGTDIPMPLKNEVFEIIVDELDEKHYGGKWFDEGQIRSEHWINLAMLSPVFRRGHDVFCLPVPYFRVLSRLFDPHLHEKVEFTADENEAINRTLDRYIAIGNAHAPEGMRVFVPPKVKSAMSAQGLTEYVDDLIGEAQECASDTEVATLLDKAIKAQMKAHAFHNLPIYLSQVATLYELAGDAAKSKEFSELFLRMQNEFTPDQIDAVFLEKIEMVKNLEKDGIEMSSTLEYELDRIFVAKKLHDLGFLRFSEGR
jgi:hypothetical protein